MPHHLPPDSTGSTNPTPPGYWGRAWLFVTSMLAGCAAAPGLQSAKPAPPAPKSVPAPTTSPAAAQPPQAPTSQASTTEEYRRDAATHLYALNRDRIWQGPLPPLLYAVGVVEVNLDRQGQVRDVRWLRAPSHAPEVMDNIVQTIKTAAPYPVPRKLGRVTWTETWLWHESGRFQLHTLTEGQL